MNNRTTVFIYFCFLFFLFLVIFFSLLKNCTCFSHFYIGEPQQTWHDFTLPSYPILIKSLHVRVAGLFFWYIQNWKFTFSRKTLTKPSGIIKHSTQYRKLCNLQDQISFQILKMYNVSYIILYLSLEFHYHARENWYSVKNKVSVIKIRE